MYSRAVARTLWPSTVEDILAANVNSALHDDEPRPTSGGRESRAGRRRLPRLDVGDRRVDELPGRRGTKQAGRRGQERGEVTSDASTQLHWRGARR